MKLPWTCPTCGGAVNNYAGCPRTECESAALVTRLIKLYDESVNSGIARDHFWDEVSQHLGSILTLAKIGAEALFPPGTVKLPKLGEFTQTSV